MKICEKFSCLD